MTESPETIHGRLLESVHVTGYTMGRACVALEWLLEEDRWQTIGGGFGNINDFLATINLSQFKIAVDERKKLAKLLADKEAHQREIGVALGVSEATVNRDLKPVTDVTEPEILRTEKPESVTDVTPEEPQEKPPPALVMDGADVVKGLQADDKKAKTRAKKDQAQAVKESADREKVEALAPLENIVNKYTTLVVDPPWSWADEGDENQLGRAKPAYVKMSLGDLLDLDVERIAHNDAHLYLWITNRSVYKGTQILDAWGFRYVTMLTWPKKHYGMGNYFRGQTEHVMFGVRGSLALKRKDVPTLLPVWPRGPQGHSSKPVEFSRFVESCSPGPYIQLFAGLPTQGWDAWGYRDE